MNYDYSKLKGRIIEKYGTRGEFAKAIKCSRQSVSNLTTGNSRFNLKTIETWREALDIPDEEIGLYFFTKKVDK